MNTTSQRRTAVPQQITARSRPGGRNAIEQALVETGHEPVRRVKQRFSPPAPVSVPRAPFVILVVVMVVAGVLGILVLNTKINENSFRLSALRDKQAGLDQQEQLLEQEIAEAQTPGNLEAAAKRLGLVPAGTPAFIRLPDGKIIGVPQPATGSPSIISQ